MRLSSLISLSPLILGLLVWEILFRWAFLSPANSAGPIDALLALFDLVQLRETYIQVGYTLCRLVSGVIIGMLAALPIGIAMSMVPLVRRLMLPSVTVASNIPVIVWIPFAVMFFGTEEAYKVSLVSIAAFLITATSVFEAAAKTHRSYIEAGLVLHFSGLNLVRHVIFPAILPAIIGAIRSGIALGWIVVFFVEYASAQEGRQGLGWLIADARNMGQIEQEFAYLIILGGIAYALDRIITQIQKRALVWMHITEQI